MSIIQSIRGKGLIVSLLIALALIVFLIQTANESLFKGGGSGKDRSSIATINGTNIDPSALQIKIQQYEDNVKARNKSTNISEEERNQVREQAWNDLVNEQTMGAEMEKLGITLTIKELQDMLTGPYADQQVQQSFTNPETGQFDPSKVKQHLSQLSSDKTGKSKAQWKDFEEALIKQRKLSKYIDLIKNGIYTPKFVIDRTVKEKTETAAISYAQLPYTMVNDSAIKISDAEINTYMQAHKDMYTMQEATASADYVVFDIIPSAADTAASLGVLNNLRADFVATSDNESFASKSDESIDYTYYNAKTLKSANANELVAAGVGTVVGPYLDNGYYKLTKIVDKKSMPDTCGASHILVAINEQRTEEQAKVIIDSIEKAVKSGANFAQLAMAKSDDQGSAKKGGDLGMFAAGMMVPEFNDACFNGKTGDMKVVKTQFGYHLLKVTAQKNFQPNVKMVNVSKTMAAGQETMNKASNLANAFVAKAKDAKSFEAALKTEGKDKRVTKEMTSNMSDVQGLGSAREVTRFAFDNKIGTVSPVLNLDNKYVVAIVTGKTEKDQLVKPDLARSNVEPTLKKEKKAAQLIEKAKGKSSLADIATLGGTQVMQADTLQAVGSNNPTLGNEPKVLGAAFNKALLNKVSPAIAGNQGVYYITVKNINAAPAAPTNYDMERAQIEGQMKNSMEQYIPAILKRKAKITDNRSSFF
jgi:peptidyl-prolyl cis-trans isomerase D